MEQTRDTDARLTNLEIKASFSEDLLDELNRTVFRQQEQIDLLTRAVAQLRRQAPEPGPGMQGQSPDDLPPHY